MKTIKNNCLAKKNHTTTIQDITKLTEKLSAVSGGGLCRCIDTHTWACGGIGVVVSGVTQIHSSAHVTTNEMECKKICCDSELSCRLYSYNSKSNTEAGDNVRFCRSFCQDLCHEACIIS